MSKNSMVFFIIILLIVGGFAIYTYDQSNQAKKEAEEKYLELESKDQLVSELTENIQEKEKKIAELEASLVTGEQELEKEYTDKLSELTEEKAKLEALLSEKEDIIKTIEKQKEESEQIVIAKDQLVSELTENIQEKEKKIAELEASLVTGEQELEKEYTDKLSELMEEKGQVEALLIEQEGISQTKDLEKKELINKLEECNNQINELKDKLVQQGIEEEKNYIGKLSVLTEEKSKLEGQLKNYQDTLSEKESTIITLKQQNEESGKSIIEKDKMLANLSESIKGYEDLVREIREQMAKEGKEKEAEYAEKLALLEEEKSTLETQLRTSQELLSEKESTIITLKQQNEESGKSIIEKDKMLANLSESIKGYENLVKEIQEQMAQEGKEKEAEYAERLALLKEGKSIIEAKLAEAIKKSIPDYYEVKKGDSLWKIAEGFYNAGGKWIRIFEANMNKIKNPSLIYPYQRLTIPKE